MAADAALLETVAAGGAPAIRIYRWQPACLSFGRNQRTAGIDPSRISAQGWDVVRRPTGGLAVLHDREITYAVVAPAASLGGPRAGYRRIHGSIARGLAGLGIPTDLAAPGSLPSPDGEIPACFAAPAGGEVLVRGRKLVGSAQRCERRTILQHGSLLLSGRQARIDAVLGGAAGPDGSIALDEVLPRVPPIRQILSALLDGFRGGLGIELAPDDLSGDERALAGRLEDMYRDDAWTWRR